MSQQGGVAENNKQNMNCGGVDPDIIEAAKQIGETTDGQSEDGEIKLDTDAEEDDDGEDPSDSDDDTEEEKKAKADTAAEEAKQTAAATAAATAAKDAEAENSDKYNFDELIKQTWFKIGIGMFVFLILILILK